MAEKEKEAEATHSEVEIGDHVRTADDRVFFAGKAQVDKRTEKAIEVAQEEADNEGAGSRSMEMEDANELGDTRTSKATGKAKPRGKRGK